MERRKILIQGFHKIKEMINNYFLFFYFDFDFEMRCKMTKEFN
jgi:hypothetical protein